MQISEAIATLQSLMNLIGDVELKCWPYDGQPEPFDPSFKVSVVDGEKFVEIDAED